MPKTITSNQLLGEQGEAAVRLRFLSMGFQFDPRSRLESGIDGIAEVMDQGRPLARMIAVQVKTTEAGKYTSEDENGFNYLLKSEDLAYWRGSNIPIIIVLHRRSDETYFWKEVLDGAGLGERRLRFDKNIDVLDKSAVDRLAAITIPKTGFGYYIPPLGEGEEAIVNILPITLPKEMFVASTPYNPKQAMAILFNEGEVPRFDWVIKGGSFWSFHDPRTSACRKIVDLDQVEAIDTHHLAFHEDEDERHNFAFLLKQMFGHQTRTDLAWSRDRELYYFKALAENQTRTFYYESTKNKAETDIVNAVRNKTDPNIVEFVRHHAFIPRFENIHDQWFLIINPTYFFTTNGYIPHNYPQALLSGKKRLDKSASLRGQIIMWHRYLTQIDRLANDLFAQANSDPRLIFGDPPTVTLETRVPEDVWNSQRKAVESESDQDDLLRVG